MEKKMPRLRTDTQVLMDKARGCSARNGVLHFDQNPKLKYPKNARCVRPNSARVRSLRREQIAARKAQPKTKRKATEWNKSVAEARKIVEREGRVEDPDFKLGFEPLRKGEPWYEKAKEIHERKKDKTPAMTLMNSFI
jgi:hypothetical protein